MTPKTALLSCIAAVLACTALACTTAPDADSGPVLVTLPDGTILQGAGARLRAVTPQGEPAWTYALDDDAITTALGIASNSTIYIRGRETLYALSPVGYLLWKASLPGIPADASGATRAIYRPVATADSGVVVLVAANRVRAHQPDGIVRWTLVIPDEATALTSPLGAPNGDVLIGTDQGLVSISPKGKVNWNRP